MSFPPGLTLFIDADDTLWENNIHFNAVVHGFCGLLEARGVGRAAAAQRLVSIERERTRMHGYGVDNFRLALEEACRQLVTGPCETELREIAALCAALRHRPVELLPRVEDTLDRLRRRHRIILMTKGDRDDQWRKLVRSPLRRTFHAIDVVREKDPDTYVQALRRHRARPGAAWMVGNSPKSDVAAALEAGLRAVFIPHHATWILEMTDLPEFPSERLLVLERFDQLLGHF